MIYCDGCRKKIYWFQFKSYARIDGVYYVTHLGKECFELLFKRIGL